MFWLAVGKVILWNVVPVMVALGIMYLYEKQL